jgi:polyisoprenyl-teichoic acid--peptidoglycan teichoic acid transferase
VASIASAAEEKAVMSKKIRSDNGRGRVLRVSMTRGVRGRRWRPIVLGLVAALLVAVVALALYLWTALTTIAPRSEVGDLVSIVTGRSDGGTLTSKIRSGQPINILFLGYGGPGHGGPYLTDSMLLLSVKPVSQTAVMISIPRDLVVPIPALPANGSITARINLAYAIGVDRQSFPNIRDTWSGPTAGGDLAAATVANVTGQPVDYWIAVDFKAFRQVVDAVGGIELTIPQPLDDPYFPAGESTAYTHIHFDAGTQHLNGERALEYARSRQTTSDFDRSRRQRLILLAIQLRIDNLRSPPQLVGLVSALRDSVRTNLRPVELRQLAQTFGHIPQDGIRQIGIDDTNVLIRQTLPDGTYLLSPREGNFAALQRDLVSAIGAPPGG